MDTALLQDMISHHGHAALLLLSVVEGPVVTVLAAALAREGLLWVSAVLALAVLGDVLGDVIVYMTGRFAAHLLPGGLRHRLGLDRHLIAPLADTFRTRGAWVIVVAKLTHVAGLPVLFASGVGRMPFVPFLSVSLCATIPKVAMLAAIGWIFGSVILTTFARLVAAPWLLIGGGLLLMLLLWAVVRRVRAKFRPRLCPTRRPSIRKRGFSWT